MFGGTGADAEEQPIILDKLVVFTAQEDGSLSCCLNPSEMSGTKPSARSGATLLEYGPDHLLLYGGFNADGKPVDDAFLLDTNTLQWNKVYNGHPDLVGQDGELLPQSLTPLVQGPS